MTLTQHTSEDIEYKGFTLTIFRDPFGRWTINIASKDRGLYALLKGDTVVHGESRDEVIRSVEERLDNLLQ